MPLRNDTAVNVRGLTELQRALRRAEGTTGKELRKGLREIAKGIQKDARGNITHKTGRHGKVRLSGSIRTSVTTKGASVFSNAPHALVQDVGGQVGRNRAALLQRASVSQYMLKATRGAGPRIERELENLLDKLGRDLDR